MPALTYFDKLFPPAALQARIAKAHPDKRGKGVLLGLTRPDEVGVFWRDELDKWFEVGDRHRAIDADLEKRLQSGDWDQFIQAVNELQAAWFFEQKLGHTISFRPAGAGRSVLEFSFVGPDGAEVFVEVKSPYDELPEDDVVLLDDEGKFRQSLKKAYKQIPKDGRRTLVVIAWEGFPVSGVADALLALYGREPSVTFRAATREMTDPRHPERFWHPGQNRSLCAVATLEDGVINTRRSAILDSVWETGKLPTQMPTPEFRYMLRAYHNPWCTSPPLDQRIFGDWPQFVPDDAAACMRWTSDPRD